MKYFIYAITIYINYVYSPVLALMGRVHDGESSDNTWALSVGLLFIVSIFLSTRSLVKKKQLRRGIKLLFFPILFFIAAFAIEDSFFQTQYTGGYPVSKWFTFSTLFIWPPIFIGIDVATENKISEIYKWVDVIAILISISMIPSMMNFSILGRLSVGGDTYQAMSYMAAFAIGIMIYGLFSPYQGIRFKIFRTKAYKIVSLILILIDVVAVFSSGGRGGALLLFLNLLICFFIFSNSKANLVRNILIVILVSIFISSILGSFMNSFGFTEIFERGIERTFSYITDSGIDMSETSERDVVYKRAYENIVNSPIIGCGIFRSMSMNDGYPHNFFLEILVSGGIIYFLFWLFYLKSFFTKFLNEMKKDPKSKFLYIFASLPCLSLLFSGTYTKDGYLWFVISYVLVRSTFKCGNLIER